MRKISLFIIPVVISIVLFSCIKDKGTTIQVTGTAPSILQGNWALVNDSTTYTGWGLWAGMPVSGVNYVGTSADYFHFTNTTVTYSEKGATDKATFAIKNNRLYFGYTTSSGKDTAVYAISNLTANAITLSGDTAVDPEQILSHIINLKKVN
jgi:hypothetical protein